MAGPTLPTVLTSGGSNTDATSYVTAAFAPLANELCLLIVVSRDLGGTPDIPTATGTANTWTQVATVTNSTGRLTIFRHLSASPASEAITIGFGTTQADCSWGAISFSNVVTSGTNGADAIVQSNTATATPITLSAFADAINNPTFSAYGLQNGGTGTPGLGFNGILSLNGLGTSTLGGNTQWKPIGDTSVDWTLDSSFGIAMELNSTYDNPDYDRTILCDAAANTKGSWQELIASSTVNAQGFYAMVRPSNENDINAEALIDIGIGAAGSEQVVVANLPWQWGSAGGRSFVASTFIPLRIPPGSRISARLQSTTQSLWIQLAMVPIETTLRSLDAGYAESETFGADTTDSAGTAVDAGATPHTKASWVELSASTGGDILGLMLCVTRSAADRTLEDAFFRVDVGVGAAASEVVVLPDLPVRIYGSGDEFEPKWSGVVPCYVPAGSRLAVRAQSSTVAAGNRVVDVIVVGVR